MTGCLLALVMVAQDAWRRYTAGFALPPARVWLLAVQLGLLAALWLGR